MLIGGMLDTMTAFATVMLILSLLVTSIQEFIKRVLSTKARTMQALLTDGAKNLVGARARLTPESLKAELVPMLVALTQDGNAADITTKFGTLVPDAVKERLSNPFPSRRSKGRRGSLVRWLDGANGCRL